MPIGLSSPMPTASDAAAASSGDPGHDEAGDATEAMRQPADSGARVVVEVGQHVREMRAGTEQGTRRDRPRRARAPVVRPRRVTIDGRMPKLDEVGEHRDGRALEAGVVRPGGRQEHQVRERRRPAERRATTRPRRWPPRTRRCAPARTRCRPARPACRGARRRGRGRRRSSRSTGRRRPDRAPSRARAARRATARDLRRWPAAP